jgi:tetratricopeptide (TPR) repeat protein
VANAVSNAGVAAYRKGELELARRCHEEARRLRDALSDLRGTSSTLGNLALLTADASEALALYEASLQIRERLGDTWGVAGSHRAMATLLLKRRRAGDEAGARAHLQRALPIFASVNDALGVAECLESLALLLAGSAAARPAAAELLGCAVGVRRASGAAIDVVTAHAEAAALRAAHTEEWARGERMNLAEALALAEAAAAGLPAAAASAAAPVSVSPHTGMTPSTKASIADDSRSA